MELAGSRAGGGAERSAAGHNRSVTPSDFKTPRQVWPDRVLSKAPATSRSCSAVKKLIKREVFADEDGFGKMAINGGPGSAGAGQRFGQLIRRLGTARNVSRAVLPKRARPGIGAGAAKESSAKNLARIGLQVAAISAKNAGAEFAQLLFADRR